MIIDTIKIENAVREIFENIGTHLDEKVYCRLKAAKGANERESFALKVLTENAEIARDTNSPVCQDTGLAVVFLEIGQDVALSGKYVEDAVNDGVRQTYENFRKSSVHPLSRKNSGDNTPAIIHTRIVKGDKVKVSCMMKGFGSENMSRLFMLTPADGVEGVVNKVVETVKDAGSCPCPPVILGVGVGGTMEKAAIMSKHALLNDLDKENPDEYLSALEKEMLEKINALGIGAEGFRGDVTALRVFIETENTHIAGLPVAVTVQCHCSRHGERIIEG